MSNILRIGSVRGPIVGIMKDFHFQSMRSPIKPLAMMLSPERKQFVLVRLRSENMVETIRWMKAVWESEIPDYPFEIRFIQDDIEEMYRSENRLNRIVQYASILSVVIACLGLFGLASFSAQQRTQEIGIRKVLGATVPGVIARCISAFCASMVTRGSTTISGKPRFSCASLKRQ